MIHIPAGPFWMGSDDHGKQERPRHRVFTDAYEIAAATVRRWEYALFLEQTGHEEPRGWHDPAFADPNQPVVGVNWFDATAYCVWLSPSGGPEYRLPTEAEWEKACKGGDDTAIYSWGEQAPGGIAYYQGEWTAPRPAGKRGPNGYGLYNMGDNVHEWCRDWYGADYYRISDRRESRRSRYGQAACFAGRFLAARRQSVPGRSPQQPSARFPIHGLRHPDRPRCELNSTVPERYCCDIVPSLRRHSAVAPATQFRCSQVPPFYRLKDSKS